MAPLTAEQQCQPRPSGEGNRPSASEGPAPAAQRELLRLLAEAASDYDARALAQHLGEATKQGIAAEEVAEARQLLDDMTREAFLLEAVEAVVAVLDASPVQPTTDEAACRRKLLLRQLQNLSSQIRRLNGDNDGGPGASGEGVTSHDAPGAGCASNPLQQRHRSQLQRASDAFAAAAQRRSSARSSVAKWPAQLGKKKAVGVPEVSPGAAHIDVGMGPDDGPFAADPDMVGIVVYLIDGHAEYMYVPVSMDLGQLGTQMAIRSGVLRRDGFGFFEVLLDSPVPPRLLPDGTKVADLWSLWQRRRSEGGQVSRLHWQRRFLRKGEALRAEDPAHAALAFRQAVVAHLRQPAPTDDDPELLIRIAAALWCAEFDQVATDPRKRDCLDLLPSHALGDLSRPQREEWRQTVMQRSRKKQLRQQLGPHVPLLERMRHIFDILQETRCFGAMSWRARHALAPEGEPAVPAAPAQNVSLHPREVEPEVWVSVHLAGVQLLVGSRKRSLKRWALWYKDPLVELAASTPAVAKAAFRAGVSANNVAALQKRRACRVLRCGARGGLLQFVVTACGASAEDPQCTISLACPQASDVAFAIREALVDVSSNRTPSTEDAQSRSFLTHGAASMEVTSALRPMQRVVTNTR